MSTPLADLEAAVIAGRNTRQMAAQFGISVRAVQRRLARAGLTTVRASVTHRADVAALTAKGLSANQIAEKLGICTRQVVRHRTAAGCAKPGPNHWTPEQISRYEYALTVDGWSYSEVQRTYGPHAHTLADRWPGCGWGDGGGVRYRRMIERLQHVDAEYWANRYARACGQNETRAAA